MTTIYAVERGEYSDYTVVGIFTTRENAQKICDLLNTEDRNEATIAEWPLDPSISELAQGLRVFNITMNYDGTTENVYASGNIVIPCGMRVWLRTKAPRWVGKPIADAVEGEVWASDEQHAIKIANEYRVQAIAEGRMHTREEA